MFVTRVSIPVPSIQGWFALFVVFSSLALFLVPRLHEWLSETSPVRGEVLVLEGWVPDYVAVRAEREFREFHYDYVCVTGGPLPIGFPLTNVTSYAHLAALRLQALGVPSDRIVVAPAGASPRGRTLAQARAARRAIRNLSIDLRSLDVLTEGPHARRSRAIFRHVFPPEVKVGVLSCPPRDYDSRTWWSTSAGVRDTLSESIAVLHQTFVGFQTSGEP